MALDKSCSKCELYEILTSSSPESRFPSSSAEQIGSKVFVICWSHLFIQCTNGRTTAFPGLLFSCSKIFAPRYKSHRFAPDRFKRATRESISAVGGGWKNFRTRCSSSKCWLRKVGPFLLVERRSHCDIINVTYFSLIEAFELTEQGILLHRTFMIWPSLSMAFDVSGFLPSTTFRITGLG